MRRFNHVRDKANSESPVDDEPVEDQISCPLCGVSPVYFGDDDIVECPYCGEEFTKYDLQEEL